MKEHQGVEGARVPPKKDDEHSPGEEKETTLLVSVGAGPAIEENKEEDDICFKVEKYKPVSPEFIVKLEAAMTKMVEGAEALVVEDDVLLVVIKSETAPEEENALTFAEPGTIVIE